MACDVVVLQGQQLAIAGHKVLGVAFQGTSQHDVVLGVPHHLQAQVPASNNVPPPSNQCHHRCRLTNRHREVGT